MKTPSLALISRRDQGAIAVEMAIILPIQVLLITVLVLFAQIFLYYGAMQKATYNAARILSTATQIEMSTPGAEMHLPLSLNLPKLSLKQKHR